MSISPSTTPHTGSPILDWVDLGRMSYEQAYDVQVAAVDRVLAGRESGTGVGSGPQAIIHFVEHDPVITVSRRPEAKQHLTATPELLERFGVSVAETDRGGDITYHGPGQLVVYPIVDLNHFNLGLHAYMRLLEEASIRTAAAFGVPTMRDPAATGVWTVNAEGAPHAKLCACGVRVRKWVSMHGLAINVHTNLDHFNLIVPCGLAGRPLTSLHTFLGPDAPDMDAVKAAMRATLHMLLLDAADEAATKRRITPAPSP
ncbi:MAG: lipoyl(octanoyl) transferase LipB [Planctomycetes bacterium]|nr:lipoyl(octanoyl) transferase LipB [Planctomycetota bacterium]